MGLLDELFSNSPSVEVKPATGLPICPHCEREMNTIAQNFAKGLWNGGLGGVVVFSCPHCRKVLSVGKGY